MRLSLIIPVYNEAAYIADCLDSATQQIEPFDEILVVDNGSTDDTVAIANSYAGVKVISEKKRGSVFARNKGFEAAKGEILARIDADTRLPVDWTTKLKPHFAKPSVAAVTGAPSFYDVPLAPLVNLTQAVLYQHLQRLLTGTYILWGANMAIQRGSWQALYKLTSKRTDIDEDVDLSFCLRQARQSVVYDPDLKVRASFLRGRLELNHSVRYLTRWPRDYELHQMLLRALLIRLLIMMLIIVSLPAFLFNSLKANSRG